MGLISRRAEGSARALGGGGLGAWGGVLRAQGWWGMQGHMLVGGWVCEVPGGRVCECPAPGGAARGPS